MDRNDPPWYPLTDAARGIGFATRLVPDNPCYNTAECVEFTEPVDAEALRSALRTVYAENEGFRVELDQRGSELGWRPLDIDEFLRRVTVGRSIGLEATPDEARRTVLDWCAETVGTALDVERGRTVDSAIIECGGRQWFYHCFHHLVADGFAAFDALRRVGQVYGRILEGEAPEPAHRPGLAELRAQDAADAERRTADLEAWSERLEHEDTPTDYSLAQREAAPSATAHRVVLPVDVSLQEAIVEVARGAEAQWPTGVVAAVGSYLSRALGLPQASFGVPQMNRALAGGPRVAARTGCTAVNVLPIHVSALTRPQDQVRQVRDQMVFNHEHALARQEDLERQAARRGGRPFGAQINVVPFDAVLRFGPCRAQVHNVSAGPVPDMTVCLRGMPGRGHDLSLELTANPDLYSPEETERHAHRILRWMHSWAEAASTKTPTAELDQALPEEIDRIRGLSATEHEVEARTLLERFEEQAERTPEALALREGPAYGAADRFGGGARTYAELVRAARDVAEGLSAAGVARGDVVGLRVERGVEQFELLYGLLYAGAVYLPIDPTLPVGRVAAMLEDAECSTLISGTGLAVPDFSEVATETDAPAQTAPVRLLEAREIFRLGREAESRTPSEAFPGRRTRPDDLAYVQFTSGSTGRPKGVPTTHRALDNRLRWQQHLIPIDGSDRIAHKTAISFDVHVWELYWPLQEGACVVIAAPGGHKDPEYLARFLRDEAVTGLHFVPTMLSAFISTPSVRALLGAERVALRRIVCSGEALTREQVRGTFDLLGVRPLNLYGPTEAAIDVTAWDTETDPDAAVVPIGRPAWNTGCHVVDPTGHLCPPGIPGELCLSGVQVMSGYLNRPDADAAALDTIPLSSGRRQPGSPDASSSGPETLRVYRTGDLAVWREDGVLEYRGRQDHQIKIRGQRLELGEVEAVLADVEGVHAAVVLVKSIGGQQTLAAFIEGDSERGDEVLAVAKHHAGAVLPEYMVPALWSRVDSMPVTTNGKADRRALDAMELVLPDQGGVPRSLREQTVCTIFADVLDVPSIGPDTDFFSAGGASLSALELGIRVEEQFGTPCSLAKVFAHPTPRSLAEALEDDDAGELEPALRLRNGQDPQATPVVFLPPAGGLGWCYASFLKYLDPSSSVWTLQARQFSDPSSPWPETLEELAEDYAASLSAIAPQGCILAGWSVGGIAAVDVAARASRDGVDVEKVVLLDAYPPSYWRGRPEPTESDLWIALMRMGGIEPREVPGDLAGTVAALREHGSPLANLDDTSLRTCITSVWKAMGYTRGRDTQAFAGRLILCSAQDSLEAGADPTAWLPWCDELETHVVEGDHAAVLRGANAESVAQCLVPDAAVRV